MRLIDADIAQAIADKELFVDEAGAVQFVLSNTSTIEAVPVRHGKWEKAKYIEAPVYVCSECGNREPLPRKFCPECGLMMETD